jgi:hypothetical protein
MQAAVTRKVHCYRLRFSLGRSTIEVSLDNQSLIDDPGIMAWDFNCNFLSYSICGAPVVPLRKFQDKFMVRSEGSGPGPNGRNNRHNGCSSSLRQVVSERLC